MGESANWLQAGEAALSPVGRETRDRLQEEGRLRRSGLPYTRAWPLSLAKEPDVVAEFVSTIDVPISATRGDEWLVFGDLRQAERRRLILGRMTIAPFSADFGEGGITHAVWKAIRPPKILAAAREALLASASWLELQEHGWPLAPKDVEFARQSEQAAQGKTRRGRKGLPERDYFELAKAYLDAQDDPTRTKGILETMSDRLGLPYGTVRSRLGTAVDLDLISAGKPGTSGREPGPRYIAIGRQIEQEER
jgi:hypothetical protein